MSDMIDQGRVSKWGKFWEKMILQCQPFYERAGMKGDNTEAD